MQKCLRCKPRVTAETRSMMSHSTCTGSSGKEADTSPGEFIRPQSAESLQVDARQLAQNLAWIPSTRSSKVFAIRSQALAKHLSRALRPARKSGPHSPDLALLRENTPLLES